MFCQKCYVLVFIVAWIGQSCAMYNRRSSSGGILFPVLRESIAPLPSEPVQVVPDSGNVAPKRRRRSEAEYVSMNNSNLIIHQNNQTNSVPTPIAAASVPLSPIAWDLIEFDSYFRVSCDLPGVLISDIKLAASNHRLYITAKRETTDVQTLPRASYRKRWSGTQCFSIVIPPNASHENVSAHLVHGVLNINLEKLPESAPRTVTIH